MKTIRTLLLLSGLAALVRMNGLAAACPACFGQSDSPMAKGMNAGVFAMLGVIGLVLCGATAFFVFLAHKSATVHSDEKSKI